MQESGQWRRDFPAGCILPYMTHVKVVVRRNIAQLGSMYARFFPTNPDAEHQYGTPKM